MTVARQLRERGITLLEAMLVTAVLGVMSILIVQSVRGLARTQEFAERQAAVVQLGERVIQRIVRDLEFSVRVFPECPAAMQLRGRLQWSEPVASGSRLPVASNRGYFEPDPSGEVETGNTLFLARSTPPRVVLYTTGGGGSIRVDAYRFVLYYLSDDGSPMLDISRWATVPIAHYPDLAAIDDPGVLFEVTTALLAEGVGYAWNPDTSVAEPFYMLDPVGGMSPLGSAQVLADPDQVQTRMLEGQRYRIPRNDGAARLAVPAYAAGTATFPNGFEVKMDGSGAGLLVLVRLVLAAPADASSQPNEAETVRLVTVREL